MRVTVAASKCSSLQPRLLDGIPRNAWIVKPAGKSRGRGIECFNKLDQILKNRGGKMHAVRVPLSSRCFPCSARPATPLIPPCVADHL